MLRDQVRDLENRLKVTTADRDAAQVTLQRRLGGAAKGRPELLALVGAQQKDLEAASQSLAQLRERLGAATAARAGGGGGGGDGDEEVDFLVSEMDSLSKSYAAAQAQNGRLVQDLLRAEEHAEGMLGRSARLDQSERSARGTVERLQRHLGFERALAESLRRPAARGGAERRELERRAEVAEGRAAALEGAVAEAEVRAQRGEKQAEERKQEVRDLEARCWRLEEQAREAGGEDGDRSKLPPGKRFRTSEGGGAETGAGAGAPPTTPKTKADMFQQHQLKHYKGMVECKVCRTRHKSVILTRCFHLFCRECIDTAMATRQRRCPTCGVSISKADIHDIFWD